VTVASHKSSQKARTGDSRRLPPRRKPGKGQVATGVVVINASFNNTIITLTRLNGDVLLQTSGGRTQKGSRKSTPHAAQENAKELAIKAVAAGVIRVKVIIKGVAPARDAAVRGLHSGGLDIASVADATPLAHNGVTPKKKRRV